MISKYRILEQFTGIGRFYCMEQHLAYVDNKDIFNLNLFVDGEPIANRVTGVYALKEGVLFGNWDSILHWFEYNGYLTKILEGYSFYPSDTYESEVILSSKSNSKFYIFEIFNQKISVELKELNKVVFHRFFGQYIIVNQGEKSVDVFDKASGTLLWRYDVTEIARWRQFPSEPEQPGEVRKFIGVWQDELLVALTNHTIIALDIHTGELKRKWRDVPEEKWRKIPFIGSSNQAAAIPYPEVTVLDSEGGKLVGASGIFYWEIDLHTGALLFKEFSAEFGTPLNEVQYSFARGRTPALSGDHLFLIGERYYSVRNGNDSEVIAFNRKRIP